MAPQLLQKTKINSKDLSLGLRYALNRNYKIKQKEELQREIESLVDERDYLVESIQDIRESQS